MTPAVILLLVAACSPSPAERQERLTDPPARGPSNIAAGLGRDVPPAAGRDSHVLGLTGIGDLRLGMPLPRGGGWGGSDARHVAGCHVVASTRYPGVRAMVVDSAVRRITLGTGSTIRLAEGIGIGAPEIEVRKWFAGFRKEPHKYEPAPAAYLTAPSGSTTDPALRIEIGRDGRVALIHVGLMPELGYVEDCG